MGVRGRLSSWLVLVALVLAAGGAATGSILTASPSHVTSTTTSTASPVITPPSYHVYATSARASSVDFVNAEDGWVIGEDGGIISTTDGGRTWATSYSGPYSYVEGLDFANASDGWALTGDPWPMLATTNGGSTWSTFPADTPWGRISGVDYVDQSEGWAITRTGQLLFSSDGGAGWSPVNTPVPVGDVCAEAGGTAWVMGADANIYDSVDDGRTWSTALTFRQVPFDIKPPQDLALYRDQPYLACSGATIWAIYPEPNTTVAQPCVIERSTDAGGHWEPVTGPVAELPNTLFDVTSIGASFPSDAWYFSVIYGATPWTLDVSTTTNAGASFQTTVIPLRLAQHGNVALLGGTFINALDGWVVYTTQQNPPAPLPVVLAATVDGGQAWQVIDPSLPTA